MTIPCLDELLDIAATCFVDNTTHVDKLESAIVEAVRIQMDISEQDARMLVRGIYWDGWNSHVRIRDGKSTRKRIDA